MDSIRLQLGRYLLTRYGKLHGAERQRAEEYLAGADRKFQVDTAQASLRSIEARLQHNLCSGPAPISQ
jgi:hypothetical protein